MMKLILELEAEEHAALLKSSKAGRKKHKKKGALDAPPVSNLTRKLNQFKTWSRAILRMVLVTFESS